jgi:hypothetical protein
MVSVLRTPFLFLYLLDNELLLAAKRKKGEGSWRLVEGERAESRFSRDGKLETTSVGLVSYISGRRLWFGQEMEAAGEKEGGAF